MIIDNEQLFLKDLQDGINIFTGAGFSVLPNDNGKSLPTAKDLCEEICEEFNIDSKYKNDLERLSNIVNRSDKNKFQEFLRKRFTVNSYNSLYNALEKVNIKSYITTNIDNIFLLMVSKSSKYYATSIYNGPIKKSSSAIQYIPLHGDVTNLSSHLYFGKNELINVDINNQDLFSSMHSELLKQPTLFWGYGFHDGSVERVISNIIEEHRKRIWVLCRESDEETIDYIRALGCYVIIGNTDQLLTWINDNINLVEKESICGLSKNLKDYTIPDAQFDIAITKNDFFQKGYTNWYCVQNNYAYKTRYVDTIYNRFFLTDNLILSGIQFCGKTTLLMQLALEINYPNKLFFNSISYELANYVINNINKEKTLIILDNCCEDVKALSLLIMQPNIKVIAATNDYLFEATKHILDGCDYEVIDVSEIVKDDAQQIYNSVPQSIQKTFSYKEDDGEKFSMLEFISKNVKNSLSKEKVFEFLNSVKKGNLKGFELIALATYLTRNNSALTTNNLFSYFNLTNFSEIKHYLYIAQNYLREINVEFAPDELEQDYFVLRSNIFVYLASTVLKDSFASHYENIIKKFIFNTSPYTIYKNNVFKRSAYDAKFFYDLFGKKADEIYKHIILFDDSEYTLQQWALYKSFVGSYNDAFALIDKAINKNPYNFSIRNTSAIIMFEANRGKASEIAHEGMRKAMEILDECYKSDKRKIYHANKYAEFAIGLFEEYDDKDYLNSATEWLKEICNDKKANHNNSSKLLNKLLALV